MSDNRILYTPREKKRTVRPSRGIFLRMGVIALIGGAVIGGIVVALHLPSLQIQTIEVRGVASLQEEELRMRVSQYLGGASFAFVPASNFFFIPTKNLLAALKKEFPEIADIRLEKFFPDRLRVTFEERTPWGILCNGGGERQSIGREQERVLSKINERHAEVACVYIDETGFAYRLAPRSSGPLILKVRSDALDFVVGTSVFSRDTMAIMRELLERMPPVLGSKVAGFEISSKTPREIRLIAAEGFSLILERASDWENVVRVLKKMLAEEIKEKQGQLDYIDLRFGNKVFYKLK